MIFIQCSNVQCRVLMKIDEKLIKPNSGIICPKCKIFNKQPFNIKQPSTESSPQPQNSYTTAENSKNGAIPPLSNAAQSQGVANPQEQLETVLESVGWIVVHDEQTNTQTYALKVGINVIGRKGSKPADILIQTQDLYMSQRHCVIEVIPITSGFYSYKIYDVGKIDGKSSKNGTYINAFAQRLKTQLPNNQPFFEEVYLKDGDLIQLGRTKIRLKTPQTVRSSEQAQQTILQDSFGKTILL